jgi:hypothetical protein
MSEQSVSAVDHVALLNYVQETVSGTTPGSDNRMCGYVYYALNRVDTGGKKKAIKLES